MSSSQRRLQEDTDHRVLRLLQYNPERTLRELANQLGISVGCVNYCLKQLMGKGWVNMQNFACTKKRSYVYVLSPRRIAEKSALTKTFFQRKMEEFLAFSNKIEVLRKELKILAKNNLNHDSAP